ncbi:hypothetical protein Esti_000177 [Eimeria stiedai]
MNFYETTYSAFHGPHNSLLASRPPTEANQTQFFQPPRNRGALWGFSDQTLPGVPGPQWLTEGGEKKDGEHGTSPFPPTTYQDSFQVRRRQFNIPHYDNCESSKELHLQPYVEEEGVSCSSGTSLGENHGENRLYDSRLKANTRHDTLSQPVAAKKEKGEATAAGTGFETSSAVVGKYTAVSQTAEGHFASLKEKGKQSDAAAGTIKQLENERERKAACRRNRAVSSCIMEDLVGTLAAKICQSFLRKSIQMLRLYIPLRSKAASPSGIPIYTLRSSGADDGKTIASFCATLSKK